MTALDPTDRVPQPPTRLRQAEDDYQEAAHEFSRLHAAWLFGEISDEDMARACDRRYIAEDTLAVERLAARDDDELPFV